MSAWVFLARTASQDIPHYVNEMSNKKREPLMSNLRVEQSAPNFSVSPLTRLELSSSHTKLPLRQPRKLPVLLKSAGEKCDAESVTVTSLCC